MISTNKKTKIDLIEKASAEAVVETETFSGGNGDTWKEKKIEVEAEKEKEKTVTPPIAEDKTPNWCSENSGTLKVVGLILAVAVGIYLVKKYK